MSKKKIVRGKGLFYKSALAISLAVLLFTLSTRKVLAVVTVVSPSNMQGWAFEINSPDGFGSFVVGPATPPIGLGSAWLNTGTNGNLSIALHNVSYDNVRLLDITNLQYSTYSQSSDSTLYPMLVMSVSTGIGPDTLIFNPANQTNQIAQPSTWQTWDTRSASSIWSSQSFAACDSKNLTDYITCINNFDPTDVTLVNSGVGSIRLQAGPTAPANVHDEYVDNFTIGVSGGDITFDFEPDVVPSPSPEVSPSPDVTPEPSPSPPSFPTDKDQCKNGGWNIFRNPTFKNQGDCISFLNKS